MGYKSYYVYIVSSKTRVLYTGVTNDLDRRVQQHALGIGSKFTAKYKTKRLVFYENFGEITQAIAAEKRIKGWKREKKIALIESANPEWKDLLKES